MTEIDQHLPTWAIRVRQLTDEINETQDKAQEKKRILQEQFDAGMDLSEMGRLIGVSRQRISTMLNRPVKRAREESKEG